MPFLQEASDVFILVLLLRTLARRSLHGRVSVEGDKLHNRAVYVYGEMAREGFRGRSAFEFRSQGECP